MVRLRKSWTTATLDSASRTSSSRPWNPASPRRWPTTGESCESKQPLHGNGESVVRVGELVLDSRGSASWRSGGARGAGSGLSEVGTVPDIVGGSRCAMNLLADPTRTPGLSYVVTTRNKLPFLEVMLPRLLEALRDDEEVVIVDGASDDGTSSYLASVAAVNHQVTVISEPDVGEAHALNKGLLLARGAIIKVMSDDDVFSFRPFESVASTWRHTRTSSWSSATWLVRS